MKNANKAARHYYIGLISGTSMDGVDAVVVDFAHPPGTILASHCQSYPEDLRRRLLDLCATQRVSLVEFLELDQAVGHCFAAAALQVLSRAGLPAGTIRAIGSHGQTVYHHPAPPCRSSLQIGDPNVIAETTGIPTVADFRRRDLSAGGEGAPLVPAYHAAVFTTDHPRAVLNLGGIANLTLLTPGRPVRAFDTGPGNVLMDAWAARHGRGPMDRDGAWAATGSVLPRLLERLLEEPYFQRPPPKSTGREHFHLRWLDARLNALSPQPDPADVQATLCELSAASIAAALKRTAPEVEELLVCGGGVHNARLMARLAAHLPGLSIHSTAKCGLDPDWVEAAAFAWLARQTLAGRTGNLPSVTGAREAVILGGVYAGGAGDRTRDETAGN